MSTAKAKDHRSSIFPSHVPIALLILGFILLPGCSSTGNKKTGPEAEAYRIEIQRVLNTDSEFLRDRNEALKKSKGSRREASRIYADYGKGLRSIDMTECPVDFQTAFLEYIHSIEDTASKMAKEPPGFGLGTLLRLLDLNPVTIIKVVSEIGGIQEDPAIEKEIQSSLASSQERWRKVELVAVQYRVRLQSHQ